MSEKASYFLNLETFKEFYSEEVEILSEYFSIHKFFDLQEIMPKKGKDTSFGVILNGEVSILDDRLENSSRTSGDFLGEMALLQSTPRTAEFIAASDGMIAIMTFDDIENLKLKYPHLAVKLIYHATKDTVNFIHQQGLAQTQKAVILIADESKKMELVRLIYNQEKVLSNYSLLASHKIAQLFQRNKIKAQIELINPNLLVGSFDTIGSRVILGKVKAVICLREPQFRNKNRSALEAIHRLCDTYNIIYATNIATAQSILDSLK